MKRKGQAALEFLTTYGWAFLVILIMIGALAYFGVLKPSRLLPDRCSVGPEFECQDFQISQSDDTIKLRLKNNLGEPVSVSSMSATAESAVALSCGDDPDFSGTWASGQVKDFTFGDCNHNSIGLIVGEKGKISFSVKYYAVRSGSGYTRQVDGEVFSTVV
ncbi:hypothetical protein ISS07_03750 [Candidatus Woesearchaeota archaeon]|nr:hypothetical protein [Candidatus Woesearchaeota archaeon]